MSAFLCDNCHITAIAQYAVQHRVYQVPTNVSIRKKTAVEILGQQMLDANLVSLRARYGDSEEFANRLLRKFVSCPCALRTGLNIKGVQLIKAVRCFEYQSCESETWASSPIAQLMEALVRHAINNLPGYEQAAWGFDCEHAS